MRKLPLAYFIMITAILLLTTTTYAQVPLPQGEPTQTQPLQPESVPRNGAGPQTFVDLPNRGHSTGYSIYVPSGWFIDHFPNEREGRTRSELPPGLGTEYEEAATLCEDMLTGPPAVSPNSRVTYNCGAYGSLAIEQISVRMFNIFATGSPLNLHMQILDEDPDYAFANKRIVNITDTTIDRHITIFILRASESTNSYKFEVSRCLPFPTSEM